MHIVIIGSGSAAFAAALKASERGARVTLAEKQPRIGGSCVNVGCVPSKIMIRAAQIAHGMEHHPFDGIERHRPAIDRERLLRQQVARVDELRRAKYEDLLASHDGLTLLHGEARFDNPRRLILHGPDGRESSLDFDRALIATGSTPMIPPIPGLADTPYWTSTEALFSETVPQRLAIIGSSVIAVEIAQAWQRLGSQVTLIARHQLLRRMDGELGRELGKLLRQEGIDIREDTAVRAVHHRNDLFTIETERGAVEAERLMISTGRRANTATLELERAGVRCDDQGRMLVDERLRTSADGIFAAGDCCALPQFVYVAATAGSRAAVNMTGGDEQLDLGVLPEVIFTDPQIATVGLTEAQAQEQGIATDSRRLDLEQLPRALANFDTRGFIKLVAERHGGRLIGAQIISDAAGELIQSAALAVHGRMTVQQLAGLLPPYLTMAEGLKLCAQTFDRDVRQLSCCAG